MRSSVGEGVKAASAYPWVVERAASEGKKNADFCKRSDISGAVASHCDMKEKRRGFEISATLPTFHASLKIVQPCHHCPRRRLRHSQIHFLAWYGREPKPAAHKQGVMRKRRNVYRARPLSPTNADSTLPLIRGAGAFRVALRFRNG